MGKYDHLSKEELLKLIEKQELELKRKKYGLVWDSEREPEQVVLDCANHLSVLKSVKSKEIKTDDSEDNILIEGDNYHALTVLNYTHKGKIDVIYIDPPYNTGKANEWKYNDKYVDKNDSYKHSKWLNFMEKRLNLAKELLKDDGVIFISIDDHELYQLKLLMDKIFGEENFIANFIRVAKGGGGHDSSLIAVEYDYLLAYGKNKSLVSLNKQKVNIEDSKYKFSDQYVERRGKYYLRDLEYKGSYSRTLDYEITCPDGTKIYPGGKKGEPYTWRWSKDKFDWGLKNDFIVFKKKNNKWKVYIKQYQFVDNNDKIRVREIPYRALIDFKNTLGSKRLNELLVQEIFKYPKPTELIYFIINLMSTNNKNLIVLDFFAGTGTTGDAVLQFNADKKTKHCFILCTNNEGNIATGVCYPRLKKVIKGYNKNGTGEWVEGLGGNLQYFKTSLIKKSKNRDQVKIDLTQEATEILCVKENIYNLEKKGEDYKIFSSNKKDKFLCIYYDFIDDSFNEFLEELKKLNGKKIIYMFAINNKVDKSLFSELEDFTIEPIPQKILDIYNQLIKMNIPIKAETIFVDLEKAKKQIFENGDKDAGAKTLKSVLEKLLQKIAQLNQINILNNEGKELKISNINDILRAQSVLSQVEWQENKTYLAIGHHALHGGYDKYNLQQVKNFYKHIQSLINKFNI